MKKLLGFVAIAFLCSPALADGNAVRLIGHFDGIKWDTSEDPHGQGYKVDLYESNGRLFGEFAYNPGSIEVTSSQLADVHWDRVKGMVTFSSKSSCCTEHAGSATKERPTRDLFLFKGKISRHAMYGKLDHRDGYAPDNPGEMQTVRLKRLPDHELPTSYEAWLANAPPLVDW